MVNKDAKEALLHNKNEKIAFYGVVHSTTSTISPEQRYYVLLL